MQTKYANCKAFWIDLTKPLWFVFILLLTTHTFAQTGLPLDFAHRDSIIESHLNSEQYHEVLHLLNEHLLYLDSTSQSDSLYLYAYKLARAEWKVNGVDASIRRMESIVDQIEKSDVDTSHILIAINDLSWIYYETGHHEMCLEADKRYLNICDAYTGSTVSMRSQALYNLGFDYLSLGDGQTAVDYFRRALQPLTEDDFKEVNRTVETYNALGAALFRTGDFSAAKEAYGQSLLHIPKLEVEGKIMGNLANCHNNLALIAHTVGDILSAKEHYEEMIKSRTKSAELAMELWDRDNQKRLLLVGYRNLCAVYITLGNYARAQKLIAVRDKLKKELLEPDDPFYWNDEEVRGTLNMLMGNLELAEANFSEYAKLSRRLYGEENYYTAIAHMHLGELALERLDFDPAKAELDTAIAIVLNISSEENTQDLPNLYLLRAEALFGQGKPAEAAQDLITAENLVKRSRPASDPILGRIYSEQSKLARLTDQIDDAEKLTSRAIEHLTQNQRSPNGIANAVYGMQLPLAYHERALVALARRQDKPSKTAALKYLEAAIRELAISRKRIMGDTDRSTLYDIHHDIFDLATEVNFELFAAENDKAYIEAMLELAEESKSLMIRYQLNRLSTTRFSGVPDSLINREQYLIKRLSGTGESSGTPEELQQLEAEYLALTEYINATHPEYQSDKHEIPTRGVDDIRRELLTDNNTLIEYIHAGENVYALVFSKKNLDVRKLDAKDLNTDIRTYNAAILANETAVLSDLGQKLYAELFQPLEDLLVGDEVVIIPDGHLFQLNFEALHTNPNRYLIEDYSISYQLSATAAIEFKRNRKPSGNHRLLAIAPGFSNEMKALYSNGKTDSAFFDSDYMNLIRQPFAVETARSVAKFFGGEALLEGRATESNLRAETGAFDILFFGTHAELNKTSPMMSRLVLSKSETDHPNDDGYLYAYEIYDMDIRAELAILTACATGSGKSSASEGIFSLAHGFAYAGTPNIVMSLWEIDEKTSARITENFMKRLRKGERKNDALRQAKLDFLRSTDVTQQSPYYWAGMVLLGDGTPLVSHSTYQGLWMVVGGFVLLVAVLVLRRKRRKTD